ncbi:MAG: VWA domain-containing protein, partial [Bacteroidota bacterium]
ENPLYLYALPLVPLLFVIRWLLSLPLRQKLEVALAKHQLTSHWTSWLRFVPDVFIGFFVAMLLVALARPQRVNEQVKKYSEGIDIILALDVSESMLIEDFEPNRLTSAKKVAKDFIQGRFQDRIGTVIFAGDAFSLAPLTTEYDLLDNFIEEIEYGIIRKPGTAIGSAIAVAINRMRESTSKTKVVILLSDGDNTAGNLDPISAAELAKFYKIKLYTILIGKEGKVPYGYDVLGRKRYVNNTVNETTLRNIANIGEGQFFRASDDRALQKVFSQISTLEKSKILELHTSYATDYYRIYLLWGLFAFLVWMATKSTFLQNMLED